MRESLDGKQCAIRSLLSGSKIRFRTGNRRSCSCPKGSRYLTSQTDKVSKSVRNKEPGRRSEHQGRPEVLNSRTRDASPLETLNDLRCSIPCSFQYVYSAFCSKGKIARGCQSADQPSAFKRRGLINSRYPLTFGKPTVPPMFFAKIP